jgi:uncharacterized repeat protein (TIGR01451 family)
MTTLRQPNLPADEDYENKPESGKTAICSRVCSLTFARANQTPERNIAIAVVLYVTHNNGRKLMVTRAAAQFRSRVKPDLLLKSIVVAWLAFLSWSAEVQAADFDLLVTASPNPVVVRRELSFTIDLTNRMGFTVTNVSVTNIYPESALLLSVSNSFGGGFTNAGLLILVIDVLTNDQPARLAFSIAPTLLRDLTNTTTVNAFGFTNATTTNVTATVVSGIADLAAGFTGPPPGTLVNDWTTYTVSATNYGPDAVPNVVLTNQLPPDVKLISVNPTNQNVAFSDGELRFSLGTLASNAFSSFQVTVQPTNAGTVTLLAQVNAANVFDTNSDNNLATNQFTVEPFLAGQLAAFISSTQQYNPQTGLMEQTVTLTNAGASDAVSARVIVQGLTNRLFNAVGTNDGHPFVVYATNLAAGASVDLLLEYFIPERLPGSDPTLVAKVVPAFIPTVPSGTNIGVTRLLVLPSGRVLIEFPSVSNRNYTVLYSDDATFSGPMMALPTVTAPADRVQWIDYGPPGTLSHPASAPYRFYRVISNP